MNQAPAIMTDAYLAAATQKATARVAGWLSSDLDPRDERNKVSKDERQEARLKKYECKACYYAQRMGGAAMTTRACMCCGTDTMYGSTNTDVLCVTCAKMNELCKHCGSDIEMDTSRTQWPVPKLLAK